MAHTTQRSSFARLVLRLGLVLGLTLLSWNTGLIDSAQAEEEESRFCQGFLYCKETKGDTTYTQAFLYLYSTEERGTYSRLTVIPFYSRKLDPARNYLRRSWLWPLGISEQKSDASYFQILPFYWHATDPTEQYTVFLPLYFDYAKGDRSYTHFIPFYGHHQRGDLYHRYYVLGPLAIATYDKQIDLKEWDILFPLFHYGTDRNGYETRLFPLYFSGEDRQNGTWYRHLVPVFGQSVTPQTDLTYLFPLLWFLHRYLHPGGAHVGDRLATDYGEGPPCPRIVRACLDTDFSLRPVVSALPLLPRHEGRSHSAGHHGPLPIADRTHPHRPSSDPLVLL